MCECKNHRPSGKETADKLWGGSSRTTNPWPPVSGKPKPFTDAETVALTRIIQDSVNELRRKQVARKPALSAAQIATIRRIVQDARKPVRESYRLGADSGRYIERVTKIRVDNPRLHGEIVHIGGMKCQLIDGRMVCK